MTNPIPYIDPMNGEAEQLIQRGLASSRDGRADEALSLYRQAAQLRPTCGVTQFLIGSELAQMGRYDDAEQAMTNAVMLRPDWHLARYQLGLLQMTLGRWNATLVTWSVLFELPATSALQRFVHGFAALASGDPLSALRFLREGIALNLDNEPLNQDVRATIARIERGQPSDSGSHAEANEPPAEPSDGQHVLLSNYRRQGSLH